MLSFCSYMRGKYPEVPIDEVVKMAYLCHECEYSQQELLEHAVQNLGEVVGDDPWDFAREYLDFAPERLSNEEVHAYHALVEEMAKENE